MKRFRLKAQPEETPAPRKETRGRKSSYEPKFARMAEAHCKLGATDAELGELFGVSTVTIWHWSNKHPEFNAALRQGKHAWDARVERSLAQRAIGYAVDTEEVKVDKDGNIIRYNLRKYFAPDTTACIFWLKNRQKAKWRDVRQNEVTGADGGPIEMASFDASKLSPEEREGLRALLLKGKG